MNSELITFGPVHLEVTNRVQSTAFWKEIIGMQLRKEGESIEFGTKDETLIVLHPVAKEPFQHGYSGLYHLAVHLPNEPEFARILSRLMLYRWPISPTDHIMSKAIYLEDPDGITIEITLETPERFKSYNTEGGRFEVIDSEGRTRGGSEALDVEEVLATLHDTDFIKPLPDDTKIGHVHLYVNDLTLSYDFYKKLGFSENLFSSVLRFGDLSAGGKFKHRIAMNTWQSLAAPQAPQGTAGMRHFTLKFHSKELLDKALKNVLEAKKQENGYLVEDPAGNRIFIS